MAKSYKKHEDVGNRISFDGEVNIQKILEGIASQLIGYQEQYGIDCFSGVNFYFNMRKDGDFAVLIDDGDNTVRSSGVKFSKTTDHIESQLNDNGDKTFRYIKEVDFDNIKENVEKERKNIVKGYTPKLYTSWQNELRKEEIEREKKFNALREQQEIIRKKQNEQRLEKERIQKKLEKDFFDFCCKHFNKTADEMKKSTSSYAFTENEKTIKGYGVDENNYKLVYRITLKDENTGKAGTAYIFDKDYNQLITIKK